MTTSRYSGTTPECLERLGLDFAVLEQLEGMELGLAQELAQRHGLMVYEAVVDGERGSGSCC